MSKPLVIMVGADKGGVGKTTVSRILDDYIRERQAVAKVYDSQWPNGDLRQFVPACELVNLESVDDQMKVFDRLRGVTLIDVKGGLFTDVLNKLARTGMLEAARSSAFNLVLLHVLGSSTASLAEISAIADKLGDRVRHILVKNYINEGGFKEWEADDRFAKALAKAKEEASSITIPHLEARASTEVQLQGKSFAVFGRDPANSFMLKGYINALLKDAYAEFDRIGLDRLISETR